MTVLHLPTRPLERVPYSRLSHEITTAIDTDLLMGEEYDADRDVVFRVTEVVETIWLIERDTRPHFTYLVSCRGPVQTSKGRDHGSRTSGASFSQGYENMGELPAEVRMVLRGPRRMAEELQELLTEVTSNSGFDQ